MYKDKDGIIVMIHNLNQLQWYGSVKDYISQFEDGYSYYISAGIIVCLKDLKEYLETYNKLKTAIGTDIIIILGKLKQLENKARDLIESSFSKLEAKTPSKTLECH